MKNPNEDIYEMLDTLSLPVADVYKRQLLLDGCLSSADMSEQKHLSHNPHLI